MKFRSRFLLTLALFALATAQPVSGQSPGENTLPEVEFSRLSQRDPNPLGEKALALYPEQWKHAETEHFVYHFVNRHVVLPISVEAEYHYRVVAMELEREQVAAATGAKSHIYVFERPSDWEQFQTLGQLEKWSGGIHSKGSLFILRDRPDKFSGNTLGHEIAHLALYRFYADGIPCWLDEGFAQYVSKNSRASYLRARGYDAKPRSRAISPRDFISLAALMAMPHPPSDRVELFYDECERLVRFLASTDKPSFLAFLDALARQQSFESALAHAYAGQFSTASVFEEKFREYATKDAGSLRN